LIENEVILRRGTGLRDPARLRRRGLSRQSEVALEAVNNGRAEPQGQNAIAENGYDRARNIGLDGRGMMFSGVSASAAAFIALFSTPLNNFG
jgi:hypothetical protein